LTRAVARWPICTFASQTQNKRFLKEGQRTSLSLTPLARLQARHKTNDSPKKAKESRGHTSRTFANQTQKQRKSRHYPPTTITTSRDVSFCSVCVASQDKDQTATAKQAQEKVSCY
jgi:hypothetical protein